MRYTLSTVITLLGFALASRAQTAVEYQNRIDIIHNNIYKTFYDKRAGLYFETNNAADHKGNYSFLWPLCALVQAANEQEEADSPKQYIAPVMKAINKYYSARPPAPAYQAMVAKKKVDSRFYDDNEWVAIALMDAYHRTHQKSYLDVSKMIYKFLLTGHDQVGGGGFYWQEGKTKSKNTCSNGPAILLALQLYKATQHKVYLDTAVVTYTWTKQHLLSAADGIYYDAIRVPAMVIDSAYYTYNSGTMLQSAVLLYNITQDKKYLDDAQNLARSAEKYFYKDGKLPGGYWFNAVMMRGYLELYRIDNNKTRLQFIIDDANRIWTQERDEQNLLGTKKVKTLIDQAAMLEIYTRLMNAEL
jgi:uncharacterized protein YyaL (SSP411 family)